MMAQNRRLKKARVVEWLKTLASQLGRVIEVVCIQVCRIGWDRIGEVE